MTNCLKCGKVLKSIGLDRKNGKVSMDKYNADWDTRKYHKKCFRENKAEQLLQWKLQGLFPI